MTERKNKPTETTGKKPKRIIPVRDAGAAVAKNTARPSALLFAEAKRLIEEEAGTIVATQDPSKSEEISLDIQATTNRISKEANQTEFGYPSRESLDIQRKKISQNNDFLDIRISKDDVWISKENPDPDIQISKKSSLDIQTSNKQGRWTKYEKQRRGKGIFLRTDDDITKEFKKFCIDNNLEFAKATEQAWQSFMTSLDIQKNKSLDIRIALNNKQLKIMWKTKPLIINLYLAYNEIFNTQTKWTSKDDRNAEIFNETDIRIIELGIIQTQMNLLEENSKTVINGFRYYANEINRFAVYENNEDILKAMLKINRKRWEEKTGKILNLEFLNNPEPTNEEV